MAHNKKLHILIVLLLFAVVACTPIPEATNTPTIETTSTVIPTETVTHTPQPTDTPQPTSTLEPTLTPTTAPFGTKAFPDAEGFGANTPGGRGGAVIKVTTLADSGTGSLRACVQESGPRICIFDVGGYIDMQSPIIVSNPYLTIAGQTAPGDGVTLRSVDGQAEAMLRITTHDVVVRFIRIRAGTPVQDHHMLAANAGNNNTGTDAVHNVIYDHVSVSWNGDEQVIFYQHTHDVTFQWSINAEAFNDDSVAAKGMVIGPETNPGGFSIHHNLFAHNNQRNPNVRGTGANAVDLRFNTIYNYGFSALLVKDNANLNVVGNYVKAGPLHQNRPFINNDGLGEIYATDNLADSSVAPTEIGIGEAETPFSAPVISGASADTEHPLVLEDAGASRGLRCDGTWFYRRDTVDARIVQSVVNGESVPGDGWLDSVSEAGGYPVLVGGKACADTDGDGMPDQWEQLHGLDPETPNNNADTDGDGYTDIEEFLNGTNPN